MASNQGSFGTVRTGEFALERTDDGLSVLTISGEHDLSTAPELRRRLDQLLDEGTASVIDLSPSTFIDSSILGVVLDCRRRASEAGMGFAVLHSNGADAVDRILEVTGLRNELPVYARREEAAGAASAAGKPVP